MKKNSLFPQRPEQFRFVNHFGPRFLKNRIRMMNQTAKYRRSWPVYVFLLAAMSLVTTMAAVVKHQRKPLERVPAKPVVKSVTGKSANRKGAVTAVALKTKAVGKPVEKWVEQPAPVLDSVQVTTEKPVVEIEKGSRYVVQQDNLIYWVVTPKMSFDELIELKRTIEEKSTYTFDFQQIKFDPFQLYINAIVVKVKLEGKSSGTANASGNNDDPIKSIGGYMTIQEKGSLGMGKSDSFGMPAVLQQLAKDDEKAVNGLFAQNRMEYFILKNQKPGPGGSTTTMGQWLRDNPGRRNENLGVFINAENRVQLYHPENVTLLINGREINTSEAALVEPKQLHTVIVKDIQDESAGPGRKKRYVQLFLNQP